VCPCFKQKEITMNTLHKLLNNTLLVTTLSIAAFVSLPAYAEGGSVHHSGQASKHTILAIGHGIGSSAKIASAVVAAPIMIVGGVSLAAGSSAMAIGNSIATSGRGVSVHSHTSGPLEITELVITADPAPNQLNANRPEQETATTTITTTETKKAVKKTTIEKKQR
jgi:hypothetical protein